MRQLKKQSDLLLYVIVTVLPLVMNEGITPPGRSLAPWYSDLIKNSNKCVI